MTSIWLVTITLIWLTTSIGAEFLRDCHTTDPKPYIYYATRTPYELINNEDSSPIFAAGIQSPIFPVIFQVEFHQTIGPDILLHLRSMTDLGYVPGVLGTIQCLTI